MRADSTWVLAAVRTLNRLELVTETLGAALDDIHRCRALPSCDYLGSTVASLPGRSLGPLLVSSAIAGPQVHEGAGGGGCPGYVQAES